MNERQAYERLLGLFAENASFLSTASAEGVSTEDAPRILADALRSSMANHIGLRVDARSQAGIRRELGKRLELVGELLHQARQLAEGLHYGQRHVETSKTLWREVDQLRTALRHEAEETFGDRSVESLAGGPVVDGILTMPRGKRAGVNSRAVAAAEGAVAWERRPGNKLKLTKAHMRLAAISLGLPSETADVWKKRLTRARARKSDTRDPLSPMKVR